MPEIKQVGGKIRYSVDKFDGGLNTNDAPSRILPNESPDCLNVVFDREGAILTRNGSYHCHDTSIVSNMTSLASFVATSVYQYFIDDATSYGNKIIVWTTEYENNATNTVVPGTTRMYYSTATTTSSDVTNSIEFVEVTAACGMFYYHQRRPNVTYQNLLFISGLYPGAVVAATGPFKYAGGQSFYKMGISYDASAPAVATTTSGGTQLVANTYYYAVSHENTQVVEGQIGAVTSGVVVPASGSVKITGIPTPSSIDGINKMYIYRAESSSGPFHRLTSVWDIAASATTESIAPSVTQVFDNTPVGQEGRLAIIDGTAPEPFSTIALHKERLFFNKQTVYTSSADASILRWTDFLNPFVAQVENFDSISGGDGEYISCVIPQDDIVTIFKQSKGWGIICPDPSDPLTWQRKEHPANIGLYSPTSAVRVQNGIFFLGRKENKVTGFHFLTGLQIVESYDGKLRSLTTSKKIEDTLLNSIPAITPANEYSNVDQTSVTYLANPDINVTLGEFKNKIYLCYQDEFSTSAYKSALNNKIIWFDLNRLNLNDPEGIGSWSIWQGPRIRKVFSHNGGLYAIDHGGATTFTTGSTSVIYGDVVYSGVNGGFVRRLDLDGEFNDSGYPIDSYFYTKEFGGSESSIEAYIKDLRDLYIWYQQLGDYKFNVYVRRDGDEGVGQKYTIGMTGDTTAAWGSAVFGSSSWGDSIVKSATDHLSVGGLMGRRFQFRFDNQNTVDQGFQVNRLEMDLNIRRRR